ncbi:MAG: glycosyltransferase family 4 protein [Candidatus Woesearchaeota archaeon]
MKLCFIAPKAYPVFNPKVKATFGGAEVQLTLLSKEIAKDENLNINFMVADYGQKDIETIQNVNIWKSLNFKQNVVKQVFNFFKIFNKIDADIYVQRTLTPQSGLIALYCKIKRKKFIYMVASDREVDKKKNYNSFLSRYLSEKTFKIADKICVQNNFQYNSIYKNFNVKTKKIVILKKGLIINKLVTSKKMYDGIWVGRCEKLKNVELFFRLAEQNKNRKFICICPKATNKEKYFNKILNKSKKIKNLKFINFCQQKEIYSIMKQSKVFIFTSEYEGDWPMTVLEATSCGIPIISYKLNYDYLIDKYEGGVLCNSNFNVFNEEFNSLLKNPFKLKEKSQNAYKYAKDNHNIKINAKTFIRIIT